MKKYAEKLVFSGHRTTVDIMAYAVVLSFSLFWIVLIFAAPFLMRLGSPERIWAGLIRHFFTPVCHQIRSRSFVCFGHPLAVCARCTGVYAGFMAGLIVFPFFKSIGSEKMPPSWILGISILPAFLEWAWTHVSGSTSSNALRSLSGGVAGTAAVFWVLPAVFQLVQLKGWR